ncbi:cholinesterase-like [Haemaphysalis longicornis]
MDKALERHIVSHGSASASSKRPNNLALYAVLLVIAMILLAFAVYFAIFKKAHLSVVVDAPWGKYRGKYKPVEGLSCYSFLGIPFANGGAPRFGLPQRPGPGAFQETSGSAPCLQQPLRLGNFAVFDSPRGTEDCLRLNLWTPSIEYKGLAVLVFFLGFEFYYGGNSQESLSGEYLSALGDLVVVVPNYRLGPLGFLNAKLSDAPGNQALYDQRHALDWVRENVRFFGGDPARIVLHGYEAGAVSIGYQLMSPLDHWVKSVSRLILQSGSPLRLFKNNTSASLENLHALQLSMKCPSDGDVRSVLDFLRRVEPETFALPATHTDFMFGPSFDTKFLPGK